MNSDNIKIYHTKEKLFSYYNLKEDCPMHSYGNPVLHCGVSSFSMKYADGFSDFKEINEMTIQPTQLEKTAARMS